MFASAAREGTPVPVGTGHEPATLTIAGEEFVVAPDSLGETQDGAAVRLWLLQPLTETVIALTRPLVRDFLFYGLLAVVLAGPAR